MTTTARVSRIALYIFLINAALVVGVAGYKQATAQLDDPTGDNQLATTSPPDVQIPSDPPSDPPSLPVPLVPPVAVAPANTAMEDSASLPASGGLSSNPVSSYSVPAEIEPPSTGSRSDNSTGSRADNMVMEEILKAIRDGRQDLEIPPLSFPSIPGLPKNVPADSPTRAPAPSSATLSNPHTLPSTATSTSTTQTIEQRLKTIAALTQSAQSLVKESQLLQSLGRVVEAEQLLQNARSIQAMIARLAQES